MMSVDYLFFCIVAGLGVVVGGVILDRGWGFFFGCYFMLKKPKQVG